MRLANSEPRRATLRKEIKRVESELQKHRRNNRMNFQVQQGLGTVQKSIQRLEQTVEKKGPEVLAAVKQGVQSQGKELQKQLDGKAVLPALQQAARVGMPKGKVPVPMI